MSESKLASAVPPFVSNYMLATDTQSMAELIRPEKNLQRVVNGRVDSTACFGMGEGRRKGSAIFQKHLEMSYLVLRKNTIESDLRQSS